MNEECFMVRLSFLEDEKPVSSAGFVESRGCGCRDPDLDLADRARIDVRLPWLGACLPSARLGHCIG